VTRAQAILLFVLFARSSLTCGRVGYRRIVRPTASRPGVEEYPPKGPAPRRGPLPSPPSKIPPKAPESGYASCRVAGVRCSAVAGETLHGEEFLLGASGDSALGTPGSNSFRYLGLAALALAARGRPARGLASCRQAGSDSEPCLNPRQGA
jgi:hypothetical protein